MGRDIIIIIIIAGCWISIHSPRMGRDRPQPPAARPSQDFNPLSPHGERPVGCQLRGRRGNFNPLSPHGERLLSRRERRGRDRFQSTLPAWGETGGAGRAGNSAEFQSTLPAWGETGRQGDAQRQDVDFNPLSPHGERRCSPAPARRARRFQSTLPAWGETKTMGTLPIHLMISIHSPRMGRDQFRRVGDLLVVISIHSPRMGRDMDVRALKAAMTFQSTLPAWGETPDGGRVWPGRTISIHSPRMGRD